MKKHHAILSLTALLALLTAMLILGTSGRDQQTFADNITCLYISGSTGEMTSIGKTGEYVYELLYSDTASLPVIDGSVHWTRDELPADHAYAICIFREPFSLDVTDSFGGSQHIEAITAILMDFDQQVVYFSHESVSLGAETIDFSQGNAVDDENGQAILAKLAQMLTPVKQ